ncbi:MAG: hypothetical protein AAGG81_05450 [Chlamydiota bacterium]
MAEKKKLAKKTTKAPVAKKTVKKTATKKAVATVAIPKSERVQTAWGWKLAREREHASKTK